MDNRRTFLKTMAMAAAAVSAPRSVLGQNDKVRMAVIGTGTRGQMVTRFFMTHPDCEFVAACDVRKTRLEQAMAAIGGKVQGYGDYRRILDRKDIDAVLVTTPDHWHGPIVAQACAAGKDAYVEKPMTHTIEDALMAVEAAKKYKRVVQLGVQQRSGIALPGMREDDPGRLHRQGLPLRAEPAGQLRQRAAADGAGAGRSRLGDVPGVGPAEAVLAKLPPVARLLHVRRRADDRLGRPPDRHRPAGHEGRQQGADLHQRLGAVRGLPEGPRTVPGRLHRHLAVRRLPDDVHQHPDAGTQPERSP